MSDKTLVIVIVIIALVWSVWYLAHRYFRKKSHGAFWRWIK